MTYCAHNLVVTLADDDESEWSPDAIVQRIYWRKKGTKHGHARTRTKEVRHNLASHEQARRNTLRPDEEQTRGSGRVH